MVACLPETRVFERAPWKDRIPLPSLSRKPRIPQLEDRLARWVETETAAALQTGFRIYLTISREQVDEAEIGQPEADAMRNAEIGIGRSL